MNKTKVVQFQYFDSIYNDKLRFELLQREDFKNNFELYNLNFYKELECFNDEKKLMDHSSLPRHQRILYWIRLNLFLYKKYKYLNRCVINIQYVGYHFIHILPFLSMISKRIILSFWGSDLLREKQKALKKMRGLFQKADYITVETNDMARFFLQHIGDHYASKIKEIRFGLSSICEIDRVQSEDVVMFRNKYQIDSKKKIVVIGYSRRKEQQHQKVIQSILLSRIDPEKIQIIIPWTYGPDDPAYRREIESLLKDRYDYTVLKEKLSDKEVAILRVISDVLVHVQTTDSLSSSMLETLYAKNEVITGAWLSYNELYNMGIKMRTINAIEDCGTCLQEFLNTPFENEVKNHNKTIIYNYSSWEKNISNWIKLYK